MGMLHKTAKFYTRIIMNNVGIFIFVGLLSVIFNDYGWFPDRNIYAISQLAYFYVLPVMVAFEGGRAVGDGRGGILAVLAVTGILAAVSSVGLFGALILGPLSGLIWRYTEHYVEQRVAGSMQMLTKNLCLGIFGSVLAVSGFYLMSPFFDSVTAIIYRGADYLAACQLEGILNIIIEPVKIFFLNNLLNHGILVPIGMGQMQERGSSVLFLLETNPGPGFGLLAALFCRHKKARSEYAAAIFTEFVGGIHEIYFPYVLSDIRMLIPLVLGGVAGSSCFSLLGAGVKGAVSPGSIVTILLMAGRDSIWPVLAGIAVSALVTFAGSMLLLYIGTDNRYEDGEEHKMQGKTEKRKIERIVFVCNGGVGSSAMGAALLRRMLAQKAVTGIEVKAFSADLVPENADLIVCQKDFLRVLPKSLLSREIYTVENLVGMAEYEHLIEVIRERNE